ncbi:DUF2584 family protein [Clostridium diolis]|uniref:Uncharacterized protein n=1 Tax=Clostridium diolis TaxID=223919 RepID=A0AAV3W5A2_9CLOT|nr:DUF2584 family protein [Clostridium diolis]GEA33635.1 hypothetical protein CDIOL_45580 [Clostridium diolis]
MGAPYEFNWYLVVASNDAIKEIGKNRYGTLKSENRIYPINSEIPLIVKEIGCIGVVRILRFTIDKDSTEIEFEYVSELNLDGKVSKHYYDMYLEMKNK